MGATKTPNDLKLSQEIVDRLFEYFKLKNLKQTHVAEELGIATAYFSCVKRLGGGLAVHILAKLIKKYPDLDANWLLTGLKTPLQYSVSEREKIYQKDVLKKQIKGKTEEINNNFNEIIGLLAKIE